MRPLKVALFGLTHPHSRPHLKSLQLSPLVSSIVLYDEDPEVLEKVKVDFSEKIDAVYDDLERLLAEETIDAGIADFHNHLNADLCLKLFANGIHVLSEKPIARTADELEKVVVAASTAGLQLGVMYQNRYHPVSQDARRLVQEGILGRATSCEARLVTSQVKFRNPSHWLFDRSKSGGGILSWLGCHYLDLLSYVLGERIVEVSAMVDTLSGEDIDVEDVASLSFRFENGTLGSLQAGYELAMSNAGYLGPNYDSYMGFRGSGGRVYWNPIAQPPELYAESANPEWGSAPARKFQYTLPTAEGYGGASGLAFLERFLRSTQGDGAPPASGADALRVARLIEAAYESSKTGRHVRLS
ncbi:MAG: Gfo/Idh/MocA family oxidoreductase [bacterium]|nr:Gfo/Idh/MocA family oxidoreductase [bacterium]